MPKTQLSNGSCYANGDTLTIQLWIKNTFQLDFGVKQFRLVLRSKKASLVLSRAGISSHVEGLRKSGLVSNHKTLHMVPTSNSRTQTKYARLFSFIEVIYIYKVLPYTFSYDYKSPHQTDGQVLLLPLD